MVDHPLLAAFLRWADQESNVKVVTLFGSHARGEATAASDVDLQVVTSRPMAFETSDWARGLGGCSLRSYAVRPATGGVRKATGLFGEGEIDLVIVPWSKLRLARLCVSLGLHRRVPALQRALGPMVIILRPGHRVLRGGPKWSGFYRQAIADVPDPRLSDEEARGLAETAYVDAVWISKKARQGELLAAQRWLHRTPAEVNFRLLNEWRLRRGVPPCFDARRAEQVLTEEERTLISINSKLETDELFEAARRSIASTRRLVRELTGSEPQWPEI
jgi:hypothetical protein